MSKLAEKLCSLTHYSHEFFSLHMHLPFPTLNVFLSSPLCSRVCIFSATFISLVFPGPLERLGERPLPHQELLGNSSKQSPGQQEQHQGSSSWTYPLAPRPPSSSSPCMDTLLVKDLPHALLRSPAGVQDIGKSCHNHAHAPCIQASSQSPMRPLTLPSAFSGVTSSSHPHLSMPRSSLDGTNSAALKEGWCLQQGAGCPVVGPCR